MILRKIIAYWLCYMKYEKMRMNVRFVSAYY
jgi:hypothetical protein